MWSDVAPPRHGTHGATLVSIIIYNNTLVQRHSPFLSAVKRYRVMSTIGLCSEVCLVRA